MSSNSEWKMVKEAVKRAEMMNKIVEYLDSNGEYGETVLSNFRTVANDFNDEATKLLNETKYR